MKYTTTATLDLNMSSKRPAKAKKLASKVLVSSPAAAPSMSMTTQCLTDSPAAPQPSEMSDDAYKRKYDTISD